MVLNIQARRRHLVNYVPQNNNLDFVLCLQRQYHLYHHCGQMTFPEGCTAVQFEHKLTCFVLRGQGVSGCFLFVFLKFSSVTFSSPRWQQSEDFHCL